VRVHFINLDRSKDRLAEFTRTNSHLSELSRFSAVDGHSLDIPSLAQSGAVSTDILDNYTRGSVGDAMSNLALWDMAINTGQDVTICEDDAIVNRGFERGTEEVIRTLPPNWDLVLWGWNFDLFMIFEMLPGVSGCLAQFEQDRMRLAADAFQDLALTPRALKLIWAFGSPCYTVSPKGARALKNGLLPFRPMMLSCPEGIRAPPRMPYYRVLGHDGALNSIYRHLDAHVCIPPLVITKNDHAASTIQLNPPR